MAKMAVNVQTGSQLLLTGVNTQNPTSGYILGDDFGARADRLELIFA